MIEKKKVKGLYTREVINIRCTYTIMILCIAESERQTKSLSFRLHYYREKDADLPCYAHQLLLHGNLSAVDFPALCLQNAGHTAHSLTHVV